MRTLLLIPFLLGIMQTISAQTKNYSSFIPRDYDTLYGGVARGDLNKDGMEDLVLALFHQKENETDAFEDSVPPRLLIILLGTKTGYALSAKSGNAILCKQCGGVFGDPFAGVEIGRNVLHLYHYGGSAWRWSYTHKFRFQNNGWYLIGRTRHAYWNVKHCEALDDMAGTDYEDMNFITGQYETKKISEDCVLLDKKKGRRKTAPLLSIHQFNIEDN